MIDSSPFGRFLHSGTEEYAYLGEVIYIFGGGFFPQNVRAKKVLHNFPVDSGIDSIVFDKSKFLSP